MGHFEKTNFIMIKSWRSDSGLLKISKVRSLTPGPKGTSDTDATCRLETVITRLTGLNDRLLHPKLVKVYWQFGPD